ncbi:MAG: caspase family protein [Pseudomonadota bacterium]|nr:caspase family protein [Pseudomonadota bacterium]
MCALPLLALPALAAAPVTLIRAQPLLAAPDGLAAEVAALPAYAPVEVLERRGGWSRVRAGDKEGWLRVLALREARSALPAAGTVAELFRAQATDNQRIVAVAGFRGLPPPRASAHALIFAISAYGNGIPPLPGVAHDADSAALMARALGVPEANTTVLENAALTLAGMRAALDGLEARVLPNDEVFLYYSGHGTRLNAFDGRAARCAEALVTADAQAFMDDELQDRLQRIAAKARRVVVFLDACHAGGATTRALAKGNLSGKFWAKSGADTCERPSNVLVRGLQAAQPGEGKLNFIHIAAARDDEVALDDGKRGGLATLAWLDCLSGAARDSNGSAGLSVAELAACAQPKIERQAAGNSQYGAHHLTLTGNAGMVLAAPAEVSSEAAAASVAKPSAVATLKDIHANRDDRRTVRLSADQATYRIKQDRVRFGLTSSHEGYVYLLMVGSDGNSFDLLFPNRKDERNHILAGETWQLPRPGWAIRAGGPTGRDHLLAVVSDNPRDFAALGMKPAGPFSVLATSPMSARDIQFVSATAAHAEQPDCAKTGAQRTLEVVATCSDAYGADLITLDEVE